MQVMAKRILNKVFASSREMPHQILEAVGTRIKLSGAPQFGVGFKYKLRHWPPGTDNLPFVPPFFFYRPIPFF
jgi:hypothetical protein